MLKLALFVALMMISCKNAQKDELPNKLVVCMMEIDSQRRLFIEELIVEQEYIFTEGMIFNEVLWEQTSAQWEINGWTPKQQSEPPRIKGMSRSSIVLPPEVPEPEKVEITFNIAGKKVTLVGKVITGDEK